MKRQRNLKRRIFRLKSDDGFTLVEILVGLSITALIATLMATALGQLRPIRDETQLVGAEMEIVSAGAYLEELISNARDIALLDDKATTAKIVFTGNSNAMRFVARTRVASERLSLRDVEISARSVEENFELRQTNRIRRVFTRTPDETFVLMKDLNAVRFSYLDRSAAPGSNAWQETWSAERSLPKAVKISLEAARSGLVVSFERTIAIPSSREDLNAANSN